MRKRLVLRVSECLIVCACARVCQASVIVPAKPTMNEEFAAGEFRYWHREITGKEEPAYDVCIGRAFGEKFFPEDIRALEGTQGFAVRTRGGVVYLFGSSPCGNSFAVYDFFERNTDIIWPSCAKDVDRIFTPVEKIEPKMCDYRRIPALNDRSWSINNGYSYNDPRTEHYCLRLKSDAAKGDSARRAAFGFDNGDWGGHNLWRYLSWDKLHEKHPEYFCMVDGIRRKQGYDATICYTAPGAAEEMARSFARERIEQKKECGYAGLGIEDANQECCCPTCLAPIPLPDGTLLTKQDNPELFKSALYYRWFNNVARELAKTHPGFKLNTIAYFFTCEPPPFPVEKNVVVNYCPIGKDTRKPFNDPSNKKEWSQLVGWSKLCPNFSVYEYWGCGAHYPRPVSYVIRKDLKIMLPLGCSRTGTEWIHKNGAEYVSAMDFWVTNKLMWDPDQDIETLRDEFFAKAFRGAAKEMRIFYDIVRDSWFRIPGKSTWSENPVSQIAFLMKDTAATEKAFTALDEAVRKATHPASRLLIEKIREVMTGYRTKAQEQLDSKKDVEIPFSADPQSLASPEGTGWANATVLSAEDFQNQPLEVAMANDGKALWFRLKSAASSPKPDKNIWLSDHWEIFMETAVRGYPYFTFAVDADGNTVSQLVFGVGTKAKIETVSVQKEAGGWRAIVKVPVDPLEIKDNAMKLLFVHRNGTTQKNTGWRGGEWFEPSTFIKTVIGKKEDK